MTRRERSVIVGIELEAKTVRIRRGSTGQCQIAQI